MRKFLFLLIPFCLIAFQNCSDANFSDANSINGKPAEGSFEVGPDLRDVPEEDRENAEEYYSCEDDDSDSSDDMDSESSDDNDKVRICHNGHEICISDNALRAHLEVHGERHSDNYGGCPDDDDSESSDDEESADEGDS